MPANPLRVPPLTRSPMRGEPCPVEGCRNPRRGEMCARHWYKVPKLARDLVWSTWHAWQDDLDNPVKLRAYRSARDDARMFAEMA